MPGTKPVSPRSGSKRGKSSRLHPGWHWHDAIAGKAGRLGPLWTAISPEKSRAVFADGGNRFGWPPTDSHRKDVQIGWGASTSGSVNTVRSFGGENLGRELSGEDHSGNSGRVGSADARPNVAIGEGKREVFDTDEE